MAYLNDIKLISYLATPPAMALSKSGRQYCNFNVRLLYKTALGDPVEQYITVTAYDTDAELLVRDCKQGDLLLVIGYLAQYKWTFNGQEYSKVMVMANSIELLARGSGMVQQPSKEDMVFADPMPYADGEDANVCSIAFRKNHPGAKGNDNYKNFPQPNPDGTWKMPNGEPNKATKAWMASRGIDNVSNEEISNHAIRTYMQMPGLPDSTINKAKFIIPTDGKVNRYGFVKMPDGKSIPQRNYENLINAQQKMLDSMTPGERETVLSIAAHFYGVRIEYSAPGESIDVPADKTQGMAASVAGNENGAATNGGNGRDSLVKFVSVASGANPDDWYQDEKGNWKRR